MLRSSFRSFNAPGSDSILPSPDGEPRWSAPPGGDDHHDASLRRMAMGKSFGFGMG